MFLGVRCDDGLFSAVDPLVLDLFNEILASGVYPEAWRIAVLVKLKKGGNLDASKMSNYRGISLLYCLSKMFASVLEKRVSDFLWHTGAICDEQFGFTRKRRTTSRMLVLFWIL